MNQKEIAKLAGVSSATISRVINGDPKVSEKTRKAVQRVIDQYAYVANQHARDLRMSHTNTIGYLISTFENPYFVSVYQGLEKICKERGYNILVGITNEDSQNQKEAIELLLSNQVAGIIGSFVKVDKTTVARLKNIDKNIISLDRVIDQLPTDLVCVDNEFGAVEQVRHAAELGHKKIAVIHGTLDLAGSERLAGYKKAIKQYRCVSRPDYIVPGKFNETAAYLATLSLLNLQDRPTAIIAHNNVMSIGAYKAIRDLNLNIPKDISLIGFDDFTLADYLSPGMTVIKHPSTEMGEIAGKLLFERLDGDYTGAPRKIVLPVKLSIRASVKNLL